MRRRIILSLGLLLALCFLGDLVALVALEHSTRQLSSLVESHRIQSMREHLTAAGLRVESDLLAEIAGYPRGRKQRSDNLGRLDESLHQCEGCHHEPVIQAELDNIDDTLRAFLPLADRMFSEKDEQRKRVLEGEVLALGNRLVRQTTDTADRASRHLASRSANAATGLHSARLILVGTLGAALVLGGIVAFHLKQRLTRPIESLLSAVEEVRGGGHGHQISIDGDEEFRRLADAFNRAYEDLRKAHEAILHTEKLAAVGKLAAGVAHEVLNPLASISSIVQLMRNRCTDEQKEQFALIMKEMARISQVLKDLQTFSRPLPTEQPVSVQIDELIEYATTLVGYDHRAQSIAITRRFDPQIGTIRGDTDRLLLVVTNIMINALDALAAKDEGAGTLAIVARRAGKSAEIRFADNGPGMTEEQIAHAFEPFFTTREPGVGTGLGLWICHQVIEAHAGTIRINSRVGEGTTVTISLPCNAPHPGQTKPTARAGKQDGAGTAGFATS